MPHFLAFYDRPGDYGFWAALEERTGEFRPGEGVRDPHLSSGDQN